MGGVENEVSWLRFRVRRLRAILRLVSDPTADKSIAASALKELIADAEKRIDEIEPR
jgi:hypothetical protein